MFKAIASGLVLVSGVSAGKQTDDAPLKLWSYVETESPLKNRRLEHVDSKRFLELGVDLSALKEKVSGNQFVEVELPGSDTITCSVKSGNPAVGEVLAAKFPSLSFFSGSCGEQGAGNPQSLELIFNSDIEGSFSATISSSTQNYYVDSADVGSSKYVIYNTKQARSSLIKAGQYVIEDKVIVNKEAINTFEKAAQESLGKVRGLGEYSQGDVDLAAYFSEVAKEKRSLQDAYTGWTFKIAFLTSQQYADYHGATTESVFAALATMVSRVNGIYMREYGSYFEFVDNQDLLICLPGRQEPEQRRRICRRVPNDSGILESGGGLMEDLGVPPSEYDIGHSVTTASGGVAAYPSLCTSQKARGTTGLPAPENDVFAVDYVAHEIGHQFFGAHSFRDCNGANDGNLMVEGAAEPGGGTSIMGYAGICGENNIQGASDPYFNSANLVPMYDYVLSVAEDGVCGTSFPVSPIVNELSANIVTAETCNVPLGSSFQLNASGITSDGFFSWDRVDLGYEDLDDSTLGRFRSWKPTKVVSRFFPNLYFQTFGESPREEALPTSARSMTFRFVERTLYDTFLTEDGISAGALGEFQVVDTQVQFERSVSPLVIDVDTVGSSVTAGEAFSVPYTAEAGVNVEFFAALNRLEEVEEFDYEDQTVELDWVAVGTGSDGVGSVTIPASVTGTVALIARVGDSACFYFDIIPTLNVV